MLLLSFLETCPWLSSATEGVVTCGKGKFITRRQYYHISAARVHCQACSLCITTSQFHRERLASHIIIITTATYTYRKTRQPIFLNSWQRMAPRSISGTSVLITKGPKKSGVFRDACEWMDLLKVHGSLAWSQMWLHHQPGHSGEILHKNTERDSISESYFISCCWCWWLTVISLGAYHILACSAVLIHLGCFSKISKPEWLLNNTIYLCTSGIWDSENRISTDWIPPTSMLL